MTIKPSINISTILIVTFLLNIFHLTFSQDEKPMPVPSSGVPASSSPLKLSISCPQNEITIGDWIQIDLTLANMTIDKMEVIKPILDIDSVSFLIKHTSLLAKEKDWSFVYSAIAPSVYDHNRNKLERIILDKYGTITSEFKTKFNIPAVAIALWEITAYYQGGREPIPSQSLQVKIISPKSPADMIENKEPKLMDGDLIANIETVTGTMKCRFFFKDAPNTVMNFIRLAKENFYNNLVFHRIVKGFMIQGGCPQGNGSSGPGYSIKAEFNKNKHLKGTISMARSTHNDSAGSQFFICLNARSDLDNNYTTFGELIEGIDVLDTIGNVPTTASPNNPEEKSKPLQNIVINKISLDFKAK